MSMADVRAELQSSLRAQKVTLQLPMGNGDGASAEVGTRRIEFTRDEFLSLYDAQDQIADIMLKSFVERYVMHYDLRREDVVRSIASIREVAEYLDKKLDELRGKLPKAQRGLIRILDMYRSNCITHAKAIEKLNEEIEEGHRGEFESEFKVRPSDWLPEPLRKFRLSVYPLVRALIDTLPDQDPVTIKALRVWYKGREVLLEEQKDQTIPQWLVGRQESPMPTPPPIEEQKEQTTTDWRAERQNSSVKTALFENFIYGIGSVLEFFPPPERFDVWRATQDVDIDEWPMAVREFLAELQEDASQSRVSS